MKLNSKLKTTSENSKSGRVRPLVLAILILVAGLWMDQWWWEIGLIILIVIAVEGYFRYRT